MSKKRYRAICMYETVFNNTIPVQANSPEEAKKQAEKDFDEWNKSWMKAGGNEKRLLEIKIEEA